jgi:hypothetical protein
LPFSLSFPFLVFFPSRFVAHRFSNIIFSASFFSFFFILFLIFFYSLFSKIFPLLIFFIVRDEM